MNFLGMNYPQILYLLIFIIKAKIGHTLPYFAFQILCYTLHFRYLAKYTQPYFATLQERIDVNILGLNYSYTIILCKCIRALCKHTRARTRARKSAVRLPEPQKQKSIILCYTLHFRYLAILSHTLLYFAFQLEPLWSLPTI